MVSFNSEYFLCPFDLNFVLEVDDAIPGDSVKTSCIPNLLSLKHEDVPFLSLPSDFGLYKFEYDTLGLEATCSDNKGTSHIFRHFTFQGISLYFMEQKLDKGT